MSISGILLLFVMLAIAIVPLVYAMKNPDVDLLA